MPEKLNCITTIALKKQVHSHAAPATIAFHKAVEKTNTYIVLDKVHVLYQGRIVKSGGKELALALEESGYSEAEAAANTAAHFGTDHRASLLTGARVAGDIETLVATLETLLRMNGATLVKEAGIYKVLPQAAGLRGNVTPC